MALARFLPIPVMAAFAVLSVGTAFGAMPKACGGKKEVIVSAGEIPLFVVNANKGVFVEMAKEAAKRADVPVKIVVVPKKRAVAYFNSQRADALIPHPKGHPTAAGYPSVPVLTKRNYAYVRKGNTPPGRISDLVGKSVGLTAQYYYSKELLETPDIKFIRSAQTDSVNLSMLHRGRIDVAIAEEISGNEAIRKSGLTGELVYDKDNPITALEVVMLFSLSECGKSLEKAFSQSLRSMESDGTTEGIMSRYLSVQ